MNRNANKMGSAVYRMVQSLSDYAEAYRAEYDSPVASDGVLGEEWVAALAAALGLLNGELGQLDAGELDRLVRDVAQIGGYDRDLCEV